MLKSLFIAIIIAAVAPALWVTGRAQTNVEGRDRLERPTPTPAPKPKTPKPESRPQPPRTAELTVIVSPPDSMVELNDRVYRATGGTFRLGGIKPGTYRVVVRKEGYRDQPLAPVRLEAGENKPLVAELVPLDGTLDVSPQNVADARIDIVRADTGARVGSYTGRARDIPLPPGLYRVYVSREGYETAGDEVRIEAAKNSSVVVSLALIPKPVPAPTPARTTRRPPRAEFPADSQMRPETYVEGKYVIVVLTGRSGDSSNRVGAVDVTIGGGTAVSALRVEGMLTGYPCQVDFVRHDNVAEYSFVEPPGVANQWARAVVRVRPKSNKRPMRFLINWKSL